MTETGQSHWRSGSEEASLPSLYWSCWAWTRYMAICVFVHIASVVLHTPSCEIHSQSEALIKM